MSTSEIAKLESRWRENPQGLTFAPLAEAYRKSRDPERALEVLRTGLERHPEYIPASIVLGRCHLDLGDDAAAETAFLRVLDLDSENVIAHKSLSDITERHSRYDESERWLRTLLSVDRSNDDARAQLDRVEAARNAPPAPDSAAVADEPAAAGSGADGSAADESAPDAPVADVVGESLVALDESWDPPMEALEADPGTGLRSDDGAPDPIAGEMIVDRADDGFERAEFGAPDGPALDGLEQQEFAAPTDAVEPVLEIEREDRSFDAGVAEIEQHDEIDLRPTGASEYQLGSAADDWATTLQPGPDVSEFRATSADDFADGATAGGTAGETAEEAVEDAPSLGAAEPVESLTAYSRDSWNLPPDERDADAALSADDEALAAAFAAAGHVSEAASDELLPVEPLPIEPEPVESEARDPEAVEPEAVEPEAVEPEAVESVVARSEEVEPVDSPPPSVAAAEPADDDEDAYDDDEATADGEIETDLVVTESMAELYMRQGHRAEALQVYRELYRRSPDDLRLRETVDALEVEEAAADAEAGRDRAAATAGRARTFAAAEPARSVAAFLGGILAARPSGVARTEWHEPATAPAAPGATDDATVQPAAPTRPASDHLSLSSVFGDEGSPVPPAVPGAAGESRPNGLSFDDFFEEDAGEGSGAKARGTVPRQEEDLDQFHAWLQNLKR